MRKIAEGRAPAAATGPAVTPLAYRRAWRLATVMTALGILVLPLAGVAPAYATTHSAHVAFVDKDGLGNIQYDIIFNGTVKPDGPTGYVVDGEFDGYCASGTITTQYATFAYHGVGDSWGYKTRSCEALPEHFHFTGTRQRGAKLELQVGATSGIANTYQYGKKMVYDIGTS
jgi:hypothetical protein